MQKSLSPWQCNTLLIFGENAFLSCIADSLCQFQTLNLSEHISPFQSQKAVALVRYSSHRLVKTHDTPCQLRILFFYHADGPAYLIQPKCTAKKINRSIRESQIHMRKITENEEQRSFYAHRNKHTHSKNQTLFIRVLYK